MKGDNAPEALRLAAGQGTTREDEAMAIDMRPTKNDMPGQDPERAVTNFDEVDFGYDERTAMAEARRCLHCKNPSCVTGCPISMDIPAFVHEVSEGRFEEAYRIIRTHSCFPAVCGRVCPQERQCEGHCVKCKVPVRKDGKVVGTMEPVAIGRLERFVADWHRAHGEAVEERATGNGHKVAVVGSGPAGLACAKDLARKGYAVTIFESLPVAGGILAYGIPEFRLPKRVVRAEIEDVERLGVRIETKTVVGKDVTIDALLSQGFEAVFVGTGAAVPRFMNIPGERARGVYTANDFLSRINLSGEKTFIHPKKVAVIGGGNVAMDACRCARRLGAQVYCVYRRSMEELPSCREEIERAKAEGVEFRILSNPVAILEDLDGTPETNVRYGAVRGIRCVRMRLGDLDASGRRRPIAIPGSEFDLAVDCVVLALGTLANPLLKETTPGLETDSHGLFLVDDQTQETKKERVYAGGDDVTGPETVVLAMRAGKRAAKAIDAVLSSK